MTVSQEGAHDQAGGPPGKWRVLWIVDDPEILVLLKTALAMHHEVVTAESGVEALRVIGLCEPDFVICDIRMPDLDGYETVAAIRGHPLYANIPVFFLTADETRDAARRGFESGCNLFLRKPFDPMRLVENINYFTCESGHTVCPKTHTIAELESILESVRRAPAETASAGPSEATPQVPPRHEPRPTAAPAAKRETSSGADLEAEHEAFLADRKKREREFSQKRYAAIQNFMDKHMNA